MNSWQNDINQAVIAFITVAQLAGDPIQISDLQVEFLSAPHRPPSNLLAGKKAIYGFWWNGEWLKIGQAGKKSAARYTSHHYNPNSSNSNLAKSLANDPQMIASQGINLQNAGQWVKTSTCRVNILLPASRRKELLSLLESFLHVRLKPRYEG
jgi:hypothetical protein